MPNWNIKSAGNYLKKNLLIYLVVCLVIILLLMAFIQHCQVNIELNKRYDCALRKIEGTDSLMQKQLSAQKLDSLQWTKIVYTGESQTKESLLKINDMKQFVFDANTVTFLVCTIIALLGGILINIEERATKKIQQMKEYHDKVIELEKERNISLLFIKLQSLESLAFSFKNIIVSNDYKINATANGIINQMYKFIEDVKLKEIPYSNDLITMEIQDYAYKGISDAINALIIDKIKIISENEGKINHIENLKKLLTGIQDKIYATRKAEKSKT